MSEKKSSIRILTYQGIPLWRDVRVLKALAQVVSALVVLGFLYFFFSNVISATNTKSLSLGFDYLSQEAGFPIGESIIDYDPSMSFAKAFAVGFLNTIKVAFIGVILATILGSIVGVMRLSSNWLIRNIASVYIETVRNIPLLVLLFFLFFGVITQLPAVENSILVGDFLALNNRALYMASFLSTATTGAWLIILAAAILFAIILFIILGQWQLRTGRNTHPFLLSLAVLLLVPLLGWFLVGEQPLLLDKPVLGRFNYEGGIAFTAQFAALLVGLVLYTGAFIAEIVRAGIQSVSRGQVEAARSIGLSLFQSLRLVIFPQAMRVIIPPLISQFLNLTKNTSLAIAIGYPDLFSVGRIMINQAGRAVPVFLMVMGTYLTLSLFYSVLMNIYNRRIQFVER
ncbi:MAG TPA: ABC transporter permease subunit [candidate division Zixibacteria bacterium]|nr:ABC transporter permease subunit [candidate division Zixibacteria bacterium]